MSLLAGASGQADTRADGIGVVAGAVASAALTEFLVLVFAHARLQGHDRDGRLGLALIFGHAHAVLVPEVAFQAEAANHAVLGAEGGGFGMGAGGRAGRTARQEFLLLGTSRHRGSGGWDLHGDSGLGLIIAFGDQDAFALVVSQIAVLAEAAAHASKGAMGRVGTSASRRARGAAFAIFGVGIAALAIERRGGDGQSEIDGSKTEQQRES